MPDRGMAATRVVALVFASVGVVLLAIAGYTGNRQYTILKTWPTAQAEVIKSAVVQGHSDRGTPMYGLDLEFSYTVNGKKFLSPTSTPYRTSSYGSMRKKAEAYAVGTRHPIRYDPNDPGEMRFDVGYNFGFFFVPVLLGGMGLVFAGIGFFLLRSRAAMPLLCRSCGQPVVRHHNFCPNCAAPLSGLGTPVP